MLKNGLKLLKKYQKVLKIPKLSLKIPNYPKKYKIIKMLPKLQKCA